MYQEVSNEKKINIRKFFELKSIIAYLLSVLVGMVKLSSGATPFGVALLGAFADTGFPLIMPLILIGITTLFAFGPICFAKFLIAAVLFAIMKSFIKGNTKTGNAAKMLFSTAISEIIILVMSETLIYDAVMAAFMSTTTAVFYLIFSEGLPIILNYDKEKITSHETLMAAGILITVVISCLGDFNIVGLSLRNILCILIVLYLGWRRGTACGIISGVSVSIVLGVLGYADASIVATYTVCGLLAGILSRYGKVGASIGFIIGNALWVFYINASTEVIIPIGEIIMASLILFFLPKRVTTFIDNMFDYDNKLEGRNPIALLAESTIFKLRSVSDVAKDMASNVEKKDDVFDNDIGNFVKNIKENVCKKCDKYNMCWEKEYHSTYESIFNLFEILKNKNQVSQNDLNINTCIYKEKLIDGLNNSFEIYKIDTNWKNKINEDKKIVAKQLRGVSKVIDSVQEQIKEKATISDNDIKTLGVGYKLEYAISKKKKDGSNLSGDNTIYTELKDGNVLVGISDGMGSGESASNSSKKVLELLEKYLNTGLEKSVAIDLINSYMLVGINNENYCTLDAAIFNKDIGSIDMIKFGTCPTYILKDGIVKMISSKSLPIGAILNSTNEIFEEKIEREAIIVMVSDGILEAKSQKEKWIKNLLEKIKTQDIQRIADIILQEAIDENLGIAKDDMTVVVVKIC